MIVLSLSYESLLEKASDAIEESLQHKWIIQSRVYCRFNGIVRNEIDYSVPWLTTGIVKLIKTIRSLMIFTVAAVIGSINFTCRLAPIVMCNIITINIVTIKWTCKCSLTALNRSQIATWFKILMSSKDRRCMLLYDGFSMHAVRGSASTLVEG